MILVLRSRKAISLPKNGVEVRGAPSDPKRPGDDYGSAR